MNPFKSSHQLHLIPKHVEIERALTLILAKSGAQSATFAYRQYNGSASDSNVYGGVWGTMAGQSVSCETQLDTPYDLASLTKLFTATAVLLLIEQGVLRLDDPVVKYLPEFSRCEVTIEHLLSHTSMLDVYLSHVRAHSPTQEALRNAIYRAGKMEGEYFYQDPNMLLLGWIVGKVTGGGLDIYLKKEVFEPLQMKNTGFNPKDALMPATRLHSDGQTSCGVVHDDTARIFGGVAGHAGCFSTAEDMLRFLAAWNGKTEGFLNRETLKDALRPRYISPDGDFAQALGWKVHSPRHNVAPFLHDAYMHGGFTGTYCVFSDQFELVVLTDFVYPGERTLAERESWWGAMRECVQVFGKSVV